MSKYLNPFYLAIISGLVALLLLIAALSEASSLQALAKEQQALKARIDSITALKSDYADAKGKQRDFLRLVNHTKVKAFVSNKDVKSNQASLSLSALDPTAAKWLIEQLVNDGYRIRKLHVDYSDKGIDIKTEVLF